MEATTGMGSLFGGVVYSLRFELAFFVCALLGWLVTKGFSNHRKARRAVNKGMQAYSEFPKSKQSPSKAGQGKHDSHPMLAAYRRGAPDDVLRLFERQRKTTALTEQQPEILQDIFAEVYAAAIRAGSPKLLKQYITEAAKLDVLPNEQTLESMIKMCTAKKFFVEALQALDASGSSDSQGTGSTWSCLLFCAVEAGQFDRCAKLYEKLRALRDPSCEDFMNMIRFVVHTKQPDRMASLLKEMRSVSHTPDNIGYNRALAVCISAEQLDMAELLLEEMKGLDSVCDAITYNTLIKGNVRAGNIERCFKLQEDMLKQGIAPSEVTFGILLDACIGADMLDRAAKVFKDFQASGCKLNAVLYTTLLKGLARANQPDQAMKIFDQMFATDVMPDVVCYSVLIKLNCDAGRMEVALGLLERLVQQGLRPDEVVYNNLLLGCAERKNSALGKRLLEDMQRYQIRPSNVTLSIMLKTYVKCKEWDEALEMLNTSAVKFGLPAENRLYVQLLQSCIRERQGKRVLEVCQDMLKRCPPDEAAIGRLMQQCISFNMLDSGAQMMECVLPPRGKVGAKDANALLTSAFKKNKTAIARSILASMQKGGIPVESGLRDYVASL